ncbi:unnamed protein product [Schistosoma curassoni]|uniref:DUF4025 domain-containing protein n=1 Tax=Schistosoma curassoni TaxID=6186 RepID=A0A183JV29_9TREM|nr:unnamed protein product [Schistosoma curassoni]
MDDVTTKSLTDTNGHSNSVRDIGRKEVMNIENRSTYHCDE